MNPRPARRGRLWQSGIRGGCSLLPAPRQKMTFCSGVNTGLVTMTLATLLRGVGHVHFARFVLRMSSRRIVAEASWWRFFDQTRGYRRLSRQLTH